MKQKTRQEIPIAAWITYAVLVAVGVVWGLLAGADVMDPVGCVLFVCAAVIGFVPWAVSMLDPDTLVGLDSYKSQDDDSSDDGHSPDPQDD